MGDEVKLPVIENTVLPWIDDITQELGVPRNVLVNEESICRVWDNLPHELKNIPSELRNELVVRMCVAIASGLFDGAINYIWNCSIINLRERIISYGIGLVAQMIGKPDFNKYAVNNLKDAELLKLCLKLNLISEEGYFFLDQCRDIRNNFSVAHPNYGLIDDAELLSFIRRCCKYALIDSNNPKGIDINKFISEIKQKELSQLQQEAWTEKIKETHDVQRELLFTALHGIYCSPDSGEVARSNAIVICKSCEKMFSNDVNSSIINQHIEYKLKGDEARYKASQTFFTKMNMLSLLDDSERHGIISRACDRLMSVHLGYDNFYNEPAFAERLEELSSTQVPATTKNEFVSVVITCYVGNPYGVSNGAIPFYEKMIRNFSPMEIQIMFEISNESSDSIVSHRIKKFPRCKEQFQKAVELLHSESIPSKYRNHYNAWMGELNV